MTQDNSTEDTETQGESSSDDSAVIRELRQQIKDMKSELKSVPNRSELEAELRAQVRKESAIEAELIHFGHPAGIREVVEGKLGDAEVTRESVAEALKAIGYAVTADESEGGGTSVETEDLRSVTELSSQVQSAAQKKEAESFYDGLNKTETPDALAAFMREQGLGS